MNKTLTEEEQLQLRRDELAIDQRIVYELVGSTPDSWNEIVLDVEVIQHERHLEIAYDISSPEGHDTAAANLKDKLQRAVEELVQLYKKYGQYLKKLVLTASNKTGNWIMDIDYQY